MDDIAYGCSKKQYSDNAFAVYMQICRTGAAGKRLYEIAVATVKHILEVNLACLGSHASSSGVLPRLLQSDDEGKAVTGWCVVAG